MKHYEAPEWLQVAGIAPSDRADTLTLRHTRQTLCEGSRCVTLKAKSSKALRPIGGAEAEVLRILWSLKKATARQVWEGLPSTRNVERGTVLTMLRRLDQKGYVQRHLEGKAHVYTAAIEPQRVLLRIVRDLVQTYFNGDASRLILHLVENHLISYGDLKQIELMFPPRPKGLRVDAVRVRASGLRS